MRTLICGDRNFNNPELMAEILSKVDITEVIEGEARGADLLAADWAKARGLIVHRFPADWKRYGKAAGAIRNKQMLIEGKPQRVIAFLAKNSVGTRDMIAQARKAGIPITVIHV